MKDKINTRKKQTIKQNNSYHQLRIKRDKGTIKIENAVAALVTSHLDHPIGRSVSMRSVQLSPPALAHPSDARRRVAERADQPPSHLPAGARERAGERRDGHAPTEDPLLTPATDRTLVCSTVRVSRKCRFPRGRTLPSCLFGDKGR